MKIISHLLMMLYVSFTVSHMHPSDAIDFLSAALKQARRLQHNELAIKYLEAKKLEADKRLCQTVANVTLDHLSVRG